MRIAKNQSIEYIYHLVIELCEIIITAVYLSSCKRHMSKFMVHAFVLDLPVPLCLHVSSTMIPCKSHDVTNIMYKIKEVSKLSIAY